MQIEISWIEGFSSGVIQKKWTPIESPRHSSEKAYQERDEMNSATQFCGIPRFHQNGEKNSKQFEQ
jgi:hypothetical protein